MIHHVMINEYPFSRSAQSNKMSIPRTNVSSGYSKSQTIFSILNLRMLDELQQNIHFHWHLSPPYNFTKKHSKNHRNILSQIVCALSSIAQTTSEFCYHEANSLVWNFLWRKMSKSWMVYRMCIEMANACYDHIRFEELKNIFPFLFHIFNTFFSPFQLEF